MSDTTEKAMQLTTKQFEKINRLAAENAQLREALQLAYSGLLAYAHEAWAGGETAGAAWREVESIQRVIRSALEGKTDDHRNR